MEGVQVHHPFGSAAHSIQALPLARQLAFACALVRTLMSCAYVGDGEMREGAPGCIGTCKARVRHVLNPFFFKKSVEDGFTYSVAMTKTLW